MTGLARRRALSMTSFWWTGTSSSGHSTPRSPRATMMPSKDSTMPSIASIACGFSILAMTGTRRPSSSMILCTSSASDALRTKLSATKSTPMRSAQRRSSMSFSDSAGTETATPGRLMPLWSLTLPPTTTVVCDVLADDRVDDQAHLAVVDQDRVAGVDVAGKPLVRRPAGRVVTRDVAGGDRPLLALLELHRAVGEVLQPDLGALEVGEDADAVPALVGGLADQPVGDLVVGVAAVAHVQPGDVHPGVDELAQPLRGRDGRAEGADDLGFAHPRSVANLGSIK